MIRKNVLGWVAVAAVSFAWWCPGELRGAVILSHQGSSDPVNEENWSLTSSSTASGVAIPDDGGVTAWGVDGTGDEIMFVSDAFDPGAHGWVLRARLRTADVPDSVSDFGAVVGTFIVEDTNGGEVEHLYQMRFGTDDQGNTLVALSGSQFGTVHTVSGPGYHLYEMRFRPVQEFNGQEVDGGGFVAFSVDGQLQEDFFTGFHPTPEPTEENAVLWGSNAFHSGQMNVNLVELEVLEEVIPEPATWSLVAAASLLLLPRRRCRPE